MLAISAKQEPQPIGEAGQDKSPIVLEARARQDHQGLALKLLDAWRQEGDLLVLENEGQISHWRTLWQKVTGRGGLYRPSYQFVDMASVTTISAMNLI